MRQEESWLCLANEAPLCTINHSRFKAGTQLLFQDLFYCTNKHLGDQTQDRTGGAAPELVPTKGGRIGNVPLIFFFFSLLFSLREGLGCC